MRVVGGDRVGDHRQFGEAGIGDVIALLAGPPELAVVTAEAVLGVLAELFRDSWGIRTADVLSAALLTLARIGWRLAHPAIALPSDLPRWQLPKHLSHVAAVPRMTSGKVDRRQAEKLILSGAGPK